jgi:hypothetical protein
LRQYFQRLCFEQGLFSRNIALFPRHASFQERTRHPYY